MISQIFVILGPSPAEMGEMLKVVGALNLETLISEASPSQN